MDSEGMLSCVLCGAACGPRSEQCRVTADTKAKLLLHAEDLKHLGLLLEEYEPLGKNAAVTVAAASLALSLVRDLQEGGSLRKLILSLHEWAIPKDEILRLRLAEPT